MSKFTDKRKAVREYRATLHEHDAKKKYHRDVIMLRINNTNFINFWKKKLSKRGYHPDEIQEELYRVMQFMYDNHEEFSASQVTRKAWNNLHRDNMKRLGLNRKGEPYKYKIEYASVKLARDISDGEGNTISELELIPIEIDYWKEEE